MNEREDVKLSAGEQKEVDRVIKNHTGDGPGDLENLPPSDWHSFAEEGVLAEDKEGEK